MKKIIILPLLIICSIIKAQTTKLKIDATCIIYNKVYDKAYAAVLPDDSVFPNNLIQINPYNGNVEKHLPLSGEPKSIELTPDNRHLYLAYRSLRQIIKIDLESFDIVGTVDIGNFTVMDFKVLPTNENVLLVSRGTGGYPDNVVMFKDGILQPKQVSSGIEDPTALAVKSDGTLLYAHDGISSGSEGHIMNIVDDGIVFNGVIWEYMLPSYGYIKIHDDLIYDESGNVLDAFSDSIPVIRASMPVYKLFDVWVTGFKYSELHGCYVFGHTLYFNTYISFFHGQYFNYQGSIDIGYKCDGVHDIDIVDETHFILITYDTYEGKNSILLYHNSSKNLILLKPKTSNPEPATNKWFIK